MPARSSVRPSKGATRRSAARGGGFNVASAARTTSGNSGATPADIRGVDAVNAEVVVTVFTGTSLDISLEVSNDGGVTWFQTSPGLRIAGTGTFRYSFPARAGSIARYRWDAVVTTTTFAITGNAVESSR